MRGTKSTAPTAHPAASAGTWPFVISLSNTSLQIWDDNNISKKFGFPCSAPILFAPHLFFFFFFFFFVLVNFPSLLMFFYLSFSKKFCFRCLAPIFFWPLFFFFFFFGFCVVVIHQQANPFLRLVCKGIRTQSLDFVERALANASWCCIQTLAVCGCNRTRFFDFEERASTYASGIQYFKTHCKWLPLDSVFRLWGENMSTRYNAWRLIVYSGNRTQSLDLEERASAYAGET